MQKKLIALAVAAAFSAPAFADTTVYGVVDAALAHVAADGAKSDTLVVSGGLAASRLGVKSVEDLSNGMKAVVVLEYGLDTQTSASVAAARQQMLAVAGDFGTVATGYLQTTGYDFANKFDVTSGSTVSPLGNVTNGGGFLIGSNATLKRAPRALAYISPDMGGVTAAFNYSSSALDTTGVYGNLGQPAAGADVKATAWLASVNYGAGPLAVGAVYAKLSTVNGAADRKEWSLGASYDFGVAKVMGTYQSLSATVANSSGKAMSIGVVAPVGPGAVIASYAKNKMDATAAGLQDSAKGMTVGYLYSLSKVTTVYAAYSKMSQDAGTRSYSVFSNGVAGAAANMALGGGSSQLAVGLNKKF